MQTEIVYDLGLEEFAIKVPGRRHTLSDLTALAVRGDKDVKQKGVEAYQLNLEMYRFRGQRKRGKAA